MTDTSNNLPSGTRVTHKGTGEHGTVEATGMDDRGQLATVAWDDPAALELPRTLHAVHLMSSADDAAVCAADVRPGDLLRGSDADGEHWHIVTTVTVEGEHVVIGLVGREDARLSPNLAVTVRRGDGHEPASYAFPLPACRAHTFEWEDGERDTCYRCGADRPGVESVSADEMPAELRRRGLPHTVTGLVHEASRRGLPHTVTGLVHEASRRGLMPSEFLRYYPNVGEL